MFCLCFGLGACLDDQSSSPPTAPNHLSIADIQGTGAASPFVGQAVQVNGVVSGDFQDNDADAASNLGGFYIQSVETKQYVGASTGLFVYDGGQPSTDVQVGDVVSVHGTVQEYFGETQLRSDEVDVSGRHAVAPVEMVLPATSVISNEDGDPIADLERYEGMLVRVPIPLTVTELYELERFGAIGLSEGGRLYQFTNGNSPDSDGYEAHRRAIARRSLLLDDGQRMANAHPILYLDAAAGAALRVGDTATGITGNLRYSRGSGGQGAAAWRLMPTTKPAFAATNPRPGGPDIGGDLRIASFNVLQYFSTIDNGKPVCGPVPSNCRGADSADEQLRQLEKITTALAMIDADIVGLIELENDESDSLGDIVSALNERIGTETYGALETGIIGDGPIRTAFIYQVASVVPVGDFALLDSRVDKRFEDNRNRPALAQTFRALSNEGLLTVVVNHLKSKGSACDGDGDINTGDGQANCNQTRTEAARALADWILRDPTRSGDPDVLIIGDLNAYLAEDPLLALKAAGFVNLLEMTDDTPAYSFVFKSQSGALDHALATPSLVPQVVDSIEWHINADESSIHDYNLEHGRDPAIFDGQSPYRSSDHDPLVIGIDLIGE